MVRIMLIIIWTIFPIATVVAADLFKKSDLSNFVIWFDPYVSILDIYERGRYNTDDLVPLISKVATRFTKMMIEFVHPNVHSDPTDSSSLSGHAAAKHNYLTSTKRKIQVFLIIVTKDCNCGKFRTSSRKATILADEINKLCNETVHTIVLDTNSDKCWSIFEKCGHALNLSDHYRWGELISVSEYCKPENMWSTASIPDLVVVDYNNWMDVFSISLTYCELNRNSTSKNPKILKRIEFADTNGNGDVNFEGFTEIWERIAGNMDDEFLVEGSFDVLSNNDDSSLSMSCDGWWYLEQDPGTTNTSEFVFQEKYSVATKIDKEENPKFLHWYLEDIFNKSTNGITFHSSFTNIVERKDFCKLFSYRKLDDIDSVISNAIEITNTCGEDFQLFLLVSKLSIGDINALLKLRKEQVTLLIVLDTEMIPRGFDESYLKIIKDSGFKHGYYIDMDYCGHYNYDNDVSRRIIDEALADTQSIINIFHYEEYKDTVFLGATRMFRLRNVLFEECRKLVLKLRKTSSEIGFALQAYHKESNFYASQWAMKNYVRYIDLCSNWATNQVKTIAFIGSDQDKSHDGYYGRNWEAVGWYSYNDFVEKMGYKPKTDRSSNMPSSVNGDQTHNSYIGSNINKILIVLCALLVLLAFIILVVFVIHRRRANYQLTYEESKIFFDGRTLDGESQQKDPNDLKYDKAKYEISERNFNVDTTELLGSGEYGRVFRGNVTFGQEEIQVAIKTTNPQKLHKTMINGLLSEIKILAHVGQHRNITQLLGANTASIRTGKIYVFLELCSLGSLESYLRKFRLVNLTSETAPTNLQELPDMDNKYANLASGRKRFLDASLSNDFNRWSKEICKGMEYLAVKHVVHADLATRNVLLNSQLEAKICDFGLSRRMYNYTSYVKSQQEPLPWRWMAPESLRYMEFNEKTDVWAYGVTLWEIYSLGSVPYAGLSWDANFVRMLEDGLIPSEPDFDENNMYNLMQKCWKILPDERPTFAQILSLLRPSED